MRITAILVLFYLGASLSESDKVSADLSESDMPLSESDKNVRQVHIALAGRDEMDGHSTSMTVSWNTASRSCSKVRFGIKSGEYTEEKDGNQNQLIEESDDKLVETARLSQIHH